MGFVEPRIVDQHVQISNAVLDPIPDRLLNIRFQNRRNFHVLQSQPHVLAADSADCDRMDVSSLEPVKIHIPQPGNVRSVLTVVIDQNNNILLAFIFHHSGNILIKPCRIFCQIQDNLCFSNAERLVPPISGLYFFSTLL